MGYLPERGAPLVSQSGPWSRSGAQRSHLVCLWSSSSDVSASDNSTLIAGQAQRLEVPLILLSHTPNAVAPPLKYTQSSFLFTLACYCPRQSP